MKLKQRVGDFRVRELLDESYLQDRGDFRVYRVSKRKLTTPEAMDALAAEAGVDRADVGIAGWKDRQGITVQYMSVPRGRKVRIQEAELKIDSIGFGNEPYSSAYSRGNGFELCVRGLHGDDIRNLRRSMPIVREHGLVDYFDDQRFGNLTHGQGWIAKELMLGRTEEALRALLTAPGLHDDERRRRFKSALHRAWGDWRGCRDVAGKFGAHHSIFEHLKSNPEDFAGAFRFVATRLRLIHLFAWQSHLWNRAAAELVRSSTELHERVLMDCEEGTLVSYSEAPPASILARPFLRLPGEGLEDITDPEDLSRFEDVLANEEMVPDQLRIDGLEGWKLKGEDRTLIVRPQHLRVRPAEQDPVNPGMRMVRLRFELPRGSYASLVVKRLFALTTKEREARKKQREARSESAEQREERGTLRTPRRYEARGERDRGSRGEERSGRHGGGRPWSGGRSDSRRDSGSDSRGGGRSWSGGRSDSRGERGSDSRGGGRPWSGGSSDSRGERGSDSRGGGRPWSGGRSDSRGDRGSDSRGGGRPWSGGRSDSRGERGSDSRGGGRSWSGGRSDSRGSSGSDSRGGGRSWSGGRSDSRGDRGSDSRGGGRSWGGSRSDSRGDRGSGARGAGRPWSGGRSDSRGERGSDSRGGGRPWSGGRSDSRGSSGSDSRAGGRSWGGGHSEAKGGRPSGSWDRERKDGRGVLSKGKVEGQRGGDAGEKREAPKGSAWGSRGDGGEA